MSRDNVTDILCIGAQRAMTSWLHHVLSAHPGTWAFPNFNPVTSTSKEAHFWDRNHARGDIWYRVLMRPLNEGLKSLDFTPEYAFLTDAQIAECKALNPGARVIYILRDPLARAVSAIRMHTMWATKIDDPAAHSIAYGRDFLHRCEVARLVEHGDYAANVARWRKKYPEMIVLNYEDLAADPVAAADGLVAACGLDAALLTGEARAAFEGRARRVNWPARPYPLEADCLDFLQGLTWPAREAAQRELGLRFTEGERLLRGGRA